MLKVFSWVCLYVFQAELLCIESQNKQMGNVAAPVISRLLNEKQEELFLFFHLNNMKIYTEMCAHTVTSEKASRKKQYNKWKREYYSIIVIFSKLPISLKSMLSCE